LIDVHFCRFIGRCESSSTDTQYCYKIAEKLSQSAREELKYQLTVSESHLVISPHKKLASKIASTCRRVFSPPKVKPPTRRTTVHEIPHHRSGDVVARDPSRVVPGSETETVGQEVFPVECIAFCNTLGDSPETLFMVCRRSSKYFVYVFRFHTVARCQVFLRRVRKLFRISEEEGKKSVEKRFSCPLVDMCDRSVARSDSHLRNQRVVKRRLCGVSSNFV